MAYLPHRSIQSRAKFILGKFTRCRIIIIDRSIARNSAQTNFTFALWTLTIGKHWNATGDQFGN